MFHQDPLHFVKRRNRLAENLAGAPLLIHAGSAPPRNYPANTYEFRAHSHFIYLTGLTGHAMQGAALLLANGRSVLFVEPRPDDDDLWHGPQPGFPEFQQASAVDDIRPLSALRDSLAGLPKVARLPLLMLMRPTGEFGTPCSELDERAASAMIELRLIHDNGALAELRRASTVTAEAHLAGMRITRPGVRESDVRAAMEERILAADFTVAYPSIVTVRGEVLHNHDRRGLCNKGDLVLADVGAETDTGWAGDVTRVWPVSGRFSPSQRAIYDIVLAAQLRAIAEVRPSVRYRDVHLAAARIIAQGLVDEGLLRGEVDGLVERGAHALFFPHGVGHLLGLDVHDMEDLGDRAGYAKGRTRSPQFGLSYLRLDRDLQEGMAVTIEPGIYFVPSILNNQQICGPLEGDLIRDRLAHFADVRGIRIEDDVLVTGSGAEILTSAIPKLPEAVEAAVGQSVAGDKRSA